MKVALLMKGRGLERAGINVYELRIEQPTLEDTFINLTRQSGTGG